MHEETSSLVRVMFYLRCICSCKLVTRTQTFKIRSNYVAFLFFGMSDRKQMMRAENPLCPKGCYVEQFYIHETMSTTRKDL